VRPITPPRGLALVACLLVAAGRASPQTVEGTRLGLTRIGEVIELRGDPQSSGRNASGWSFLSFGRTRPITTFYFAEEDSIVEWVRVYPEPGRTVARVREVFGRPDTVKFGDDLLKIEAYKGRLVWVVYGDDNTVDMIEYHPLSWNTLGARRGLRADSAINVMLLEALTRSACPRARCLTVTQAADSVTRWRWAERSLSGGASATGPRRVPIATRRAAARLDSLCTVYQCREIRRRFRAYENFP
jgi:hypothetical protein